MLKSYHVFIMTDINPKYIQKTIQPILWDYDIDPVVFYNIALGKHPAVGMLDQERALLRILQQLPFYDILDLFGQPFLKKVLTQDLIKKMRFAHQRQNYEIIRKILQREPVSFSGWSAETRQRCRNAVLSKRWYCTEPSLFYPIN